MVHSGGGARTAGDPAFAHTYGFPKSAGGLLVPLHPLLGGDKYQLRYQPGTEPVDAAGKLRRFIDPRGQRGCLATSPLTRGLLGRPHQPIFIVEGVTRVDALAAYGVPAVAIKSITGWRGTVADAAGNTTKAALPDWNDVGVDGNIFYLVPDGDMASKSDVWDQASGLRAYLLGKGAQSVDVLLVPDGMGLDDWIAVNRPADVEALSRGLSDMKLPPGTPRPPRWKPTDPQSGDYHHQGAAARILLHRAENLLAVKDDQDGGRVSLRVDDGSGIWRDDAEQLHMVHTYAMEAWEREGMDAGVPLYGGGTVWQAFQTFKRGSLSDAGHKAALASITGAIGVLEERGDRPAALMRAKVEQLDAQTRYLGCLNGVVDLQTGEKLDPAAARDALVTRRIPTAYSKLGDRPEHPAVTAIREHLSAAGLWEYTCALMGHTIWGQPNLFVYIVGEPEQGKTTLLTAMANTLGIGEEAHRLAEAALAKDTRPTRGPDESQTAVVDGRLAFAEEASSWNINCERLKDWSGDGPGVSVNRKNEHVRTEQTRGTIWLAGNAPAHLDWDDAVAARANLIDWPALGSTGRTKDDSVKDSFKANWIDGGAAARTSLLSYMVAAAVEQGRPAVRVQRPPAVLEFITKIRGDQENPVVKWAHMVIQRRVAGGRALDAGGRLLTTDLWAAWCTYNGEETDTAANTKVDGFDKGAVTAAVRKALKLPVPSVIRTNRGQGKGWYGVEIAQPETADAAPCCPHPVADHDIEGACVHAECDCLGEDDGTTGQPPGGYPGQAHIAPVQSPPVPIARKLDSQIQRLLVSNLATRRGVRAEELRLELRALRAMRDAAPDVHLLAHHITFFGGVDEMVERLRAGIRAGIALRGHLRTDMRLLLDALDWPDLLRGIATGVDARIASAAAQEQQDTIAEAISTAFARLITPPMPLGKARA